MKADAARHIPENRIVRMIAEGGARRDEQDHLDRCGACRDRMAALASDFTPLSDLRASAAYRLQVAQNLLRRFWLETRSDSPLPAAALSVWARETTP